MRKNYMDIITQEPGKRGGRPRVRGMRMAVADVCAALAKGEADIAASRVITLGNDDEVQAFFARL